MHILDAPQIIELICSGLTELLFRLGSFATAPTLHDTETQLSFV